MPQRILLFILLAAFLFSAQAASADTPPTPRPTRLPTPLPGGDMMPAWMTPPAPGPTQADAGALVYYYSCMACHGDKGQGLTVEWRAQWDVEHQYCARPQCHGARHPPEGFTFPKNFAPAIIGSNTLTKYENAQALFNFISEKMPYQTPGALTTDEYWQLTAYLLKQRGIPVSHLDKVNAANVSLSPAPPTFDPVVLMVGGGVLLLGILGGAIWFVRTRQKPRAPAA